MLINLVYMSAATRDFDSFELTALLAKAREKNSRLDVTGMLVYHDDAFLQVLEGHEPAVQSLYDRIKLDDRHTNCTVLLRSFIDQRNFGEWTMGFVNTKLYGPKTLPGFSDFFGRRFDAEAFKKNSAIAQKLLLGFRDGQWRQAVDHGAPTQVATI
ncbi:MAG TPA: BLUF domain-containing protein [Pirellulales bacterium]|nr:BLUF domain-containing protein [Pirellulales bacterium]